MPTALALFGAAAPGFVAGDFYGGSADAAVDLLAVVMGGALTAAVSVPLLHQQVSTIPTYTMREFQLAGFGLGYLAARVIAEASRNRSVIFAVIGAIVGDMVFKNRQAIKDHRPREVNNGNNMPHSTDNGNTYVTRMDRKTK